MTFPEVQFVASPDVGAAVRFDFNQAGSWSTDQIWPAHDGVSLGAPTLEGDPDGIGTEYGFRQLSFDLIIVGTHASAATKVSALAKELTRQTNWLRVRMTPTSVPVWFKTYRSAPSAIDFEHVYAADDVTRNTFGVSIELDADPFAYGARVTIPTATIANNPAAGTNPVSFRLPKIVGDGPTPLRVDLSTSTVQASRRFLMSTSALPAAYTTPIVWPIGTGDGWTVGADTGAAVASASFSGGSYRPVTFATTPGNSVRLSGIAPTVPPAGRYKILLRMARSDVGSKFEFTLATSYTTGATVPMDRSATASVGYAQWVDLGDFTLPDGLADMTAVASAAPSVSLSAKRTAGTGEARLDAFLLVPIRDSETTTLFSTLGLVGTGAAPFVSRWDGAGEWFQMYQSGAAISAVSTLNEGSFPLVWPGDNDTVMHLLLSTDSTEPFLPSDDNGDSISVTTAVTLSYVPRYLYLAGS